MIRAAIVGGSGYGGMELLRLSLAHPELEVCALTSRSATGAVGDHQPHLRGFTELHYSDVSAVELAKSHDLLFFATPHGVAASQVPGALAANPKLKVIDLSGDHRLKDVAVYNAAYDSTHAHPESLAEAVYGLPECGFRSAIAGARLVANPGCHATASLLATWPLVNAGLVDGRIAVSSVTGSSGSGSSPSKGTHHPWRSSNFRAYRPLGHQHVPEIVAALTGADGVPPAIDFVPHSAPMARGIAVTAFVPVQRGKEERAVAEVRSAYQNEAFVRVLDMTPEVLAVSGSNMADVAAFAGDGVVVVCVTIDNLGKGMAGSAVQNANILYGLDERSGLFTPGAAP
ncbi:MAG: N-acetyl-gamma-glutamyl-phosphate/LysW-gamma-L-alpha-aminoadipyl-6-phosphate reductase [Pseudohongiellaceae bacterium]|jgi:N-acetyl-gamma-glutamyl-phosphate/LysW-gamma-L-alpha-aminoadipyl-6-phosphate reductase